MAGTINISHIGKIDEIPNKPIYFLASIIDNDIWITKNIKYNTLSDDMADVISTKINNKIGGNITYLGTLSTNWNSAYTFSDTWSSKLTSIFDNYPQNTAILTQIDNNIHAVTDRINLSIDQLSSNTNQLSSKAIQISSQTAEVSSTLQQYSSALEALDEETIANLRNFTRYVNSITANTAILSSLSNDIYNDEDGNPIENIIPGNNYNIVDTVNMIISVLNYVEELEPLIDDQSEIITIKSCINKLIERNELSGKVDELSGKVTQLSGKVNELSGKVDELSGKTSKLQLSANEFDRNIKTLSSFVYNSSNPPIGNMTLDQYIRSIIDSTNSTTPTT